MAKIGWGGRGGSPGVGTVVRLPEPARPAGAAPHPCASCGTCCRTYIVPVCGQDVWRLARHLHVDPADFLVAWREEEPGPDRFRVEPDGPPYTLVLDKRAWSREQSACVFLLRLPNGQDRCGVYDHRPAACRAYPMLLLREAVALRDDPLCPPGAWPPDEPRRPAWREALQRARMGFDVYHLVVARWNARLASGGTARFGDYYAYLLGAYDALAELDEEVGPDVMADLVAGWRAPLGPGEAVEAMPWQGHLDRVRAVLARL